MGSSEVQVRDRESRLIAVGEAILFNSSKGALAVKFHVTRQTITRDIRFVRQMWREAMMEDPLEQRAIELAKINEAEDEARRRYKATLSVVWYDRIQKARQDRIRLLGLERVITALPGSTPETPFYVAPVGGIRWEELPEEIAEEVLILNARIQALQPGVEGLIIDQDGEVVS